MIRRNVIIRSICLAFIFFAISLNTHAQSITAGQSQKLKGAIQGEIVYFKNFFDQDFPKIQYEKIILPGPQYIISDDPEYIRVPEAVLIQVFEPSETEDINPIEITYSPPGASCLPTPLIFIPSN